MHLQSPKRGQKNNILSAVQSEKRKINKMHDNTQLTNVLTWNIMQLNTIYSILQLSHHDETANLHNSVILYFKHDICHVIISVVTCNVQYIENQLKTTVISQHAAWFSLRVCSVSQSISEDPVNTQGGIGSGGQLHSKGEKKSSIERQNKKDN